jgi:hypothetical protein
VLSLHAPCIHATPMQPHAHRMHPCTHVHAHARFRTRRTHARARSGGAPSQPPACSESGATCLSCGIGISLPGFDTAAEQRAHFKTDWHRYNVRRRVQGAPPVGEEAFDALIADHESQVCVSCVSVVCQLCQSARRMR